MRPLSPPRRPSAAAGLALLIGLAGCGDSQPIARVGSSAITRADYVAAAGGLGAQYPAEPDLARQMLVEDLVRRRLLVMSGRQRGLFEDTVTTNYRRIKEEELLIQALGRALTPTSISASEAEMRQLHAWRDSAARVQVVFAFSRSMGERIASEARAGADFAELANRYNPPGMIPPGGDIGPQPPGNLLDPLDEPVRTSPPGSIVGPLESPNQGWFVLRIGERTPNPQPDFENARPMLADLIRGRKRSGSVIRAVRRLRESYALTVLPGAAQIVHAYISLPPDVTPQHDEAELQRPLARWETPEGTAEYTFGDAVKDLAIPDRDKPNASLLPSVEQWILQEAGRRIQVIEARRRGLDRDPAFVRQLDETVNNFMLESLYAEQVTDQVALNPLDAVEAYERHRSQFETLEGVTVQVVDFADSAAAYALATRLAPGVALAAAAQSMPEAPAVRTLDLRFPSRDPEWGPLEEPLAGMAEGQVAGPFQTASGWRTLQIVLKRTRVTPFEALDPNQRQAIEQQGFEIARERRLMAWIEELRREFPVTVDTTRVRKLPWPVPAPNGATRM